MNRWVMALTLSLVLGASNFFYQAVTSHDWATAAERSWFQAGACFVFAINVGVWNLKP